jgi:glutamine amidotransferase
LSDRVAIIDYGMGNLRSVEKGFEKVGVDVFVTGDPRLVDEAAGVVLPGVGAFADAIEQLKKTGLDRSIKNAVESGRPFLGICLGLQLLFERSYENGDHQGLGIFRGSVERLPAGVKIPHMGWNQVKKVQDLEIMAAVPDGANFYFVHSYVVRPADSAIVATATDYGSEFASGVAADNVLAFQFHPEKSGEIGLSILKRFGARCGALRTGALN